MKEHRLSLLQTLYYPFTNNGVYALVSLEWHEDSLDLWSISAMTLYNFECKATHIYGAFDSFMAHSPQVVGEQPAQVEAIIIKGHKCML